MLICYMLMLVLRFSLWLLFLVVVLVHNVEYTIKLLKLILDFDHELSEFHVTSHDHVAYSFSQFQPKTHKFLHFLCSSHQISNLKIRRSMFNRNKICLYFCRQVTDTVGPRVTEAVVSCGLSQIKAASLFIVILRWLQVKQSWIWISLFSFL